MTRLCSPEEEYEFLKQIGDGSFGTVHKARNKKTRKPVAIKVMKKKYTCLEDCESQFEPKLVELLPYHINIVQLYDSFLTPSTHDLSFIMEYMDGGNLYQLMKDRKDKMLPFDHFELKSILFQILSAVSHIHHHNIFHRDMKPENLLLDYSSGRPILKLADFGLAREINSQPPYTEYVSTRWYRAPEVLLRSTEYSAPVDLWALGAIFAELITLEPLFPGESEIDQIYRICEILGSPGNKVGFLGQRTKRAIRPQTKLSPGFARKKAKEINTAETITMETSTPSTISILDGGGEWKEGVKLAYKIGFKFPQVSPKPLESVIPNATKSMLDLIQHFLFFNPHQRRSADAALKHPFFTETEKPVHKINSNHPGVITPPEQLTELIQHTSLLSDITPLDLLDFPNTPYQVCPDWNGSIKPDESLDPFLKYAEPDHYLTQARPIYSSQEKVRPLTGSVHLEHDRSLHSSQEKVRLLTGHVRPSTPKVEHVSSREETTKRPLLHYNHHPHHNDYHARTQLIKWTPPHFIPPSTSDESEERPESRQSVRPESRQSVRPESRQSTRSDFYEYRQEKFPPKPTHRLNLWVPDDDTTTDDDDEKDLPITQKNEEDR